MINLSTCKLRAHDLKTVLVSGLKRREKRKLVGNRESVFENVSIASEETSVKYEVYWSGWNDKKFGYIEQL